MKIKKMNTKNQAKSVGKPWVVYAKKPFGSPKSVVEYLADTPTKLPSAMEELGN